MWWLMSSYLGHTPALPSSLERQPLRAYWDYSWSSAAGKPCQSHAGGQDLGKARPGLGRAEMGWEEHEDREGWDVWGDVGGMWMEKGDLRPFSSSSALQAPLTAVIDKHTLQLCIMTGYIHLTVLQHISLSSLRCSLFCSYIQYIYTFCTYHFWENVQKRDYRELVLYAALTVKACSILYVYVWVNDMKWVGRGSSIGSTCDPYSSGKWSAHLNSTWPQSKPGSEEVLPWDGALVHDTCPSENTLGMPVWCEIGHFPKSLEEQLEMKSE